MKKLFVKGTTPVREVDITNSDKTATITVAFFFPSISQFPPILEGFNKAIDADKAAGVSDVNLVSFIREQIRYCKNTSVDVYDDDTEQLFDTITIEDTRKVEPTEYWKNPKECLEALLEHFTDSVLWKDSIFDAYNSFLLSMINGGTNFAEDSTKN